MSTDPSTYDPIYVSVGDLPIQGPDDYTTTDKRRALFQAEAEFELDVNGGAEIASENLTNAHRTAVLNLGTYHLAKTADSPQDVTLGDMDDEGDESQDYAEQYLDAYVRIIESINESGGAGPGGSGGGVYYGETGSTIDASQLAVNQRDADAMRDEYPFNQNDRFPNQ